MKAARDLKAGDKFRITNERSMMFGCWNNEIKYFEGDANIRDAIIEVVCNHGAGEIFVKFSKNVAVFIRGSTCGVHDGEQDYSKSGGWLCTHIDLDEAGISMVEDNGSLEPWVPLHEARKRMAAAGWETVFIPGE